MCTASSHTATCLALASASEYTATVFTPRRLAVAATRQAISPRFAIRIFFEHLSHLGRTRKKEDRRRTTARRSEQHHQQQHRHRHHHDQRHTKRHRVLRWPATPRSPPGRLRRTTAPSWKTAPAMYSPPPRVVILVASAVAERPARSPPARPWWRCRHRTHHRPGGARGPCGSRARRPRHCPPRASCPAKNSTSSMKPLTISTSGCCSMARPGGNGIQPSTPSCRPGTPRRTAETRWPSPARPPRPKAGACQSGCAVAVAAASPTARGMAIHMQPQRVEPPRTMLNQRGVHGVVGADRSAQPGGLALVEERLHAFLAFVAGTDVGNALHGGGDQPGIAARPRPAPASCRRARRWDWRWSGP